LDDEMASNPKHGGLPSHGLCDYLQFGMWLSVANVSLGIENTVDDLHTKYFSN
jgi:hypothetical protein